MTNRVDHLLVELDGDYRDDDLEAVMNAIRCIRCVASVGVGTSLDPSDHLARNRAKREIREKLLSAIDAY